MDGSEKIILSTDLAGFKGLPVAEYYKNLPDFKDANFNDCIGTIFDHEGFYSNDRFDPGGITKYGVSLRLAVTLGDLDGDGHPDLDINRDGVINSKDIMALTLQDAAKVYYHVFWKVQPYGLMPKDISRKIFDLAVNMGHKPAHKLLQRAVRSVSKTVLIEDGIIGKATLDAVGRSNQPTLLAALRSEAAGFYRMLVQTNPKSSKYLGGWLNRAYF